MIDFITLAGDYAYEQYKVVAVHSTVIDASDASWIVSNMGDLINRYPIVIEGSNEVSLLGGTIIGEVPLEIERVDAYVNSAAIFLRDSDNSLIQSWRIMRGAWDGIRVRNSDNFKIDGIWMSDIRDDAVENDDGLSGAITDSLFDGVFVGMSSADASSVDRSSNIVTFDRVLIRMKSYLDHGVMTHQSPFKVTSKSPRMKILNTVLAIEDVNHIGQERLRQAWEKTISASSSYFLNLSDTPLAADYPLPPEGFTVLQGEEARAFWNAARSGWLARRADRKNVVDREKNGPAAIHRSDVE